MRKNLIFLLCVILQFYVSAQNCNTLENYSADNNWTIEGIDRGGNSINPQTISIANGTFNYEETPDAWNVIRAYRPLGYTLCNSWQTEFIFNPTSVNNDPLSAGHIIFSATAGSLAPMRVVNQNTDTLVWTDQDAIGVVFRSNGTEFDLEMLPFIKNGTDWITPNCAISLDGNQTITPEVSYRVRLERISRERGRLTVFRVVPEGEDERIGECCFDIPPGVEGLSVIQHANATGGNHTRIISGTIDDLCIQNCFRRENCCIDQEIIGNTLICASSGNEFVSDTFSVTNSPDASYTWNVPSGILFRGQGTNSITVTNWAGHFGPITISVDITCGCETTTRTIEVNLLADLSLFASFDLMASSSGNTVNYVKGTPRHLNGPTNVIHWWNIFEAENSIQNDATILNEQNGTPVALRNPVTTAIAEFETPDIVGGMQDLLVGTPYVVVHRVNYEGEPCEWVEYRYKFMLNPVPGNSNEAELIILSEDNTVIGEFNTGFTLYPNPSTNYIQLKLLGSEKAELITVYNTNGNKEEVVIKDNRVDISGLKRGVYLVKMETAKGSYTRQFIKE
ncbi:T9SS type A sorting domain-containing protein [Tenacibaculum xiamenense]|uniref:T9SS type A sorting domain-containing protein n=1 Tax=Tenacibaculum xiamenense TaxID=1261553 RepID=UPI0038947432